MTRERGACEVSTRGTRDHVPVRCDRVPESKGQPLSSWGPQSPRLEARPLKYTPTQQAQKCLHKARLRQELRGRGPSPARVRVLCVCGALARDGRRGSITRTRTHRHTHTHTDGPGSAQAPGTVHSGQSEKQWLYQPGQAGHGGMESGQGLKDQRQGTTSARRGPVQAALPRCGGRAPV